jgi:hypothetical protein
MTKFDEIKSKNIDEFAEWLDEHGELGCSPWSLWWDDNYCFQYEPVTAYVEEVGDERLCAWCELNGKCKFFKELDGTPDNKYVIKLWLETEA